MGDLNLILKWLKTTDINLSVISRNTGISRKSLYNWSQGSKPTIKSLEKLTSYYNKVIENDSVKVDSTGNIDKDYVIQLQKEKIEALEEINEKNKMEKNIWDAIEYDAIFEVQLSYKKLKLCRTINIASGLDILSRELGYTIKELTNKYFCLGEAYEMRKHPIDKIMTKETHDSLKIYSENFKTLFKTMRGIIGDHYIPFNVTYISKDGNKKLQASVYSKVYWTAMKIESKVKMFI